jgi:hypothetical protein
LQLFSKRECVKDDEQVSVVNVMKRKMWLRTTALIAVTCLLLNVWGCACFQPMTKVEHAPATGKEEVKHEEMPLGCKIFWGTIWVLSWFLPGDKKDKTEEEKRQDKMHADYERVKDKPGGKDKYPGNL